jgi:hypothetical protein
MKIITGTVVAGKVELPRDMLAEGERVAVIAPEDGEPVHLSPAQEREVTEAMAAIRRGEYVDGADLLSELRSPPRA